MKDRFPVFLARFWNKFLSFFSHNYCNISVIGMNDERAFVKHISEADGGADGRKTSSLLWYSLQWIGIASTSQIRGE